MTYPHLHRVVIDRDTDRGPDTIPAPPPPPLDERQRLLLAEAYQSGADSALNRYYPQAWRWGVVCGSCATATLAVCAVMILRDWGWL
jgi:hypothetical protein